MSYPQGKRFIQVIQASPDECQKIRDAFYLLRTKYIDDNPEYSGTIDLTLKEQFAILGEAFQLASTTLRDEARSDTEDHFIQDVLMYLVPDEWDRKELEIIRKENDGDNSVC